MANVPGLDVHIVEQGSLPFVWGRRDCCLFVADWILSRTGIDPARAWRGTYDGLRVAHRRLSHAGGFVSAISAEMAAAGFHTTDDPLPGDVGIVRVPVGVRDGKLRQGEVAAVRVGRLWTVKGRMGVAGGEFPCVVAWAIDRKD